MNKSDKIRKLIEMQRKFIEQEHAKGVTMREYFAPEDDSPLHNFREDYLALAMEIVDDAHKKVGSSR